MSDELNYLKSLLPDWPVAINPLFICNQSDEDKMITRATQMLDIIVKESLNGKKFLDFGCGNGHAAIVASSQAKLSIGYDIVNYDWKQNNLTTDYNVVLSNAPYDIILVYDVIDHVIDSVKTMQQIKECLSPTGKIYMRCHPFSSRHATHLYQQINKAYLHLAFTDDELKEMGFNQMMTIPINDYNDLIRKSGLHVVSHDITREPVEDFFHQDKVLSNRLKGFPISQMEQQFHDFVLAGNANSVVSAPDVQPIQYPQPIQSIQPIPHLQSVAVLPAAFPKITPARKAPRR